VRRWKQDGDAVVQIIKPLEQMFRCFNICGFRHSNGLSCVVEESRRERRYTLDEEWSTSMMNFEAVEGLFRQLFGVQILHKPWYTAFWAEEEIVC
jgi:hypothetical protein